jgi:hypothetical protein
MTKNDEAVIRLHDIARLVEREYLTEEGIKLSRTIRDTADKLNELIKSSDNKN